MADYDDYVTLEANGGTYTALIVRDGYAEAPYDEMADPVARVEYHGYSWRADFAFGNDVENASLKLAALVERYGRDDGIATFARYVRLFHGGQVLAQGSPEYHDPAI
jgi:hypothetical protein